MLIGLTGYPKAGKSTVANILVMGHGFYRLDTKKILRDMTSQVSGDHSEYLKKQSYKEKEYNGVSNREIMGELGKTLERLFGEDFLITKALEASFIYPDKKIVVDGLRRDQSLNFKGKVLEIVSDSAPTCKFDFDEYNRTRIHHTINNSGDLQLLEESVKKFVEKLAKEV